MSDKQQQVSRTIDAPPEKVFALLADPGRHTEIDGAGHLKGLAEGGRLSGVGDTFVMDMNQEGIGDYQMRSEVVEFEPGHRIAWAPAIHPPGSLSHLIGDMNPSGHVWSWELEPAEGGGTTVTHTYDWSGVGDESALVLYPRVTPEQMDGTVQRIADALGG